MRVPLLALAVLACAASTHAAILDPRCESSKLLAAAGASLKVVKCHAKAASLGVTVDPACVTAATQKLAASFARAETKPPCVAIGEATPVNAVLTSLGLDLVALTGDGPSRCDSKKLLAAGKRAHAKLKAQAAHAKKPEDDRLTLGLGKPSGKFVQQVAAAESGDDCSVTGLVNTLDIARRTDTGVDDVVDLVRGTLQGLAAESGRTIGAAVRANVLAASDEVAYRDTLRRHVGAVTAEYEFMWGNLEPTPGTYLFEPIETILSFAEDHGFPAKGAPLVWHLILPPWVNGGMTAAELQAAVDERIDVLMTTYAGRVTTWDVVNEAAADFGAALRDTIFLQKLGPDYIRNAFLRARQADPSALLFYNDYLADGVNGKSDFIYDTMVSLLAQGTPIDGVSFQMHLGGLFGPPPTRQSIRQNLQRFAALGLVVRISEMDVQLNGFPGDAAEQLARQRAVYQDAVAACMDVPACDSVTFWGISDAHTWIQDYLHLDDRPLPFDGLHRPKAAFFGVRDALLGY